MNDREDDSPEGQLADGILDQIARFERLKIAERSRRGKLRKVREGKLVAPRRPRYGFKLNAARDAYEINEEEMEVVRRIFYMVGVEGRSPGSLARILQQQGVKTPTGARRWDRSFFRECVLDDLYNPHSFEEVRTVVPAAVAARLDPGKRYGLWWFNRRGVEVRQISEPGPDGRRYRKTYRWHRKPREEWEAVPVPDSGIPREQVEAVRAVVESNRKPARAGRRLWELTGGVAYCGECGQTMCATHSTKTKKGRRYSYDYYTCSHHNRYGAEACANAFRPRAQALEGLVRKGVFAYIEDPERLRADLEHAIDLMRQEAMRGDPVREAKMWAGKIAEVDRKRARYQEMAAGELITLDELRARLAELGETRDTVERELAALRNRTERIEELERDAEAILEGYARMTPDALDNLTPEERHRVYKMLGLKATVGAEGSVEIDGTFIVDGPLELGKAFERSEGERTLLSTDTADKRR